MINNERQHESLPTTSKTHSNHRPKNKKSDEIERINQQLNGFNWKNSKTWQKIQDTVGNEATLITLRIIAQDISIRNNIKIGRDEKRRKCVLVKWFHDNWDKLDQCLHSYSVLGDRAFYKGFPIMS